MPDVNAKPPRRLHDLALAETRASIEDEYNQILAERKQHYAEIKAAHPRTPMPTTVDEAWNII